MNTKKPSKYTDEDILTMNKVTAKIAANYLGGRWTYEMLTWMLRQDAENGTGKAPFGKAVHRKNWSYYIFPEELVKYKHGYCPGRDEIKRAEFIELFKKLDEGEQNQVKGFMKALLMMKEAV